MGAAQLSVVTEMSCQCFPSWEANQQEDSPGLWQEAFSDPTGRVVPSHTGTLPPGRMRHKENSNPLSPKPWCSESLQHPMTTLGNPK